MKKKRSNSIWILIYGRRPRALPTGNTYQLVFFLSKWLQFLVWPAMDVFNMYKIWQKIKPLKQNEHKHGAQSATELTWKLISVCLAYCFVVHCFSSSNAWYSYWLSNSIYVLKCMFLKHGGAVQKGYMFNTGLGPFCAKHVCSPAFT